MHRSGRWKETGCAPRRRCPDQNLAKNKSGTPNKSGPAIRGDNCRASRLRRFGEGETSAVNFVMSRGLAARRNRPPYWPMVDLPALRLRPLSNFEHGFGIGDHDEMLVRQFDQSLPPQKFQQAIQFFRPRLHVGRKPASCHEGTFETIHAANANERRHQTIDRRLFSDARTARAASRRTLSSGIGRQGNDIHLGTSHDYLVHLK